MKNFMITNIMTQNLMSFSGFKAILIFSLLLEGPKSYKDIQDAVYKNEYLHETASIDTIRIYINTLKHIGCNIKKTTKHRITYYQITSHPFELNITDEQVKSIIKLFSVINQDIDIEDFIALKNFFSKISAYIKNEDLKLQLLNVFPISDIDNNLLNELREHAKNRSEIRILYNSKNSGVKNIDILIDKLQIINGKLYLCGYNSEYKNYSNFLVSKIVKIVSSDFKKYDIDFPMLVVRYELKKNNYDNYVFLENETIVEESDEKYVIEIMSKNKFNIMQRILSFSNNCRVIAPDNIKNDVISCLKKMKEGYFDNKKN